MEQLSLKERLLLANQCRILERLYPEDAAHYAERREALERGYILEYDSLFEIISPREMSEAECRWVMDVLDMYSSLQNALTALNDKEGIHAAKVHFRGFDGNDESEFRGYALYLQRAKRWENVLGRGDLNSHAPTRDRYDRMLEEWKASVDKDELTKADVKRIIA